MNGSELHVGGDRAVFQILTTRFTVTAVGSRAVAALRVLPSGLVHDTPPRRHRAIAITHRDGRYEIAFDGRPRREEYDAHIAMQWMLQELTETALDDHGRGAALSAGSAIVGGRRVLFAGGGRATRTQLALRLLLDGHDVESDRYSLLDGDGGAGLPFRFALSDSLFDRFPELGSVPPSAPFIVDEQDYAVYLFSPSDFGLKSRVTWGPVDAVFLLDVNWGGDTRVASVPRLDVLETLVPGCVAWRPPRGNWIGPLTAALGRAKTYRLYYGDTAVAGRLIEEKTATL